MLEGKSYQNWALLVICVVTVLVPFMGSAMNLALPFIAREFSLDAISLSWVVSIFLLISAILPVPFSRLADMIGRNKIFTAGIVVFTLASIGCGFATSGLFLIIARFLQGIGASMIFATNMAILTSIFPAEERGKALGINTAIVYISLSSGPFIGGILTHYYGWRSLFFVTAGIGVLSYIGVRAVLKDEWIESAGEPFDWKGVLFYGGGLSMLIYGFSTLPSLPGFLLIAGGLIILTIFILYEKELKFPMLNVRLFWENKIFGFASTAGLINYAATFAISFLLSLYLQYIRGMTPRQAGLILITQPIVQTILSPLSGKWSDRMNARKLATSGMGLIVIGLVLLFFLNPATPIIAIIGIAIILGCGFGLFSSPNVNVIMGSVEKKYLGMASATTNTMRLTGQAFSMGITMMVISIIVGKVRITQAVLPQLMTSIHITYIILALLCCLGVYTSWNGVKIKTHRPAAPQHK